MTVLFTRCQFRVSSIRALTGVGLMLGLAACGDTGSNWEPQDMFAAPTEQKLDDRYRAMIDFKAMARDVNGKEYAAGPKATVLGAVEEAVAMCSQANAQGCKAVRVGLTWVDGLDQVAIESVIQSYNDTMTAEAYHAAGQGNMGAANWLAYHYAVLGENLTEAERLSKQALSVAPDDPGALDTYGLILYRQGRYQEAEEVFIRVNKAMPTAEHIAHFADNALAMGKAEMARAAYQRALQAGAGPVLSQTIQKRLLALDLNGAGNAQPAQ
ncbi:tetratricopeptide repeat protein [Thalassospira sp. SM2505]